MYTYDMKSSENEPEKTYRSPIPLGTLGLILIAAHLPPVFFFGAMDPFSAIALPIAIMLKGGYLLVIAAMILIWRIGQSSWPMKTIIQIALTAVTATAIILLGLGYLF